MDHSTRLDGDRTTDADDSLQDTFDSIHYDRDAQGSSSSSADNELQTPSPLSVEAVPVAESSLDAGNEVQGIVDTHFARLLSSLTLSAKEAPFDVVSSSSPAASSTPTPADSPVKASQSCSPSPSTAASNNDIGPQRADRELQQSLPIPPFISSLSTSENTLDRASLQHSGTRELPGHPLVQDASRRMKHLALLESVANESICAPIQPSRHQGQPTHIPNGSAFQERPPPPSLPPHSSVPPPFVPLDQRFVPSRQAMPQQGYRNFVNPHVHLLNVNDPIQGRPMTSNAVLPPSVAQRRLMHHGSAMSLHQGNLLFILGSNGSPPIVMEGQGPSTGMPTQMFDPTRTTLGSPAPLHPILGNVPPQNIRQNGLTVVPPPARMIQNGPLTAPLMKPSQQNSVFHPSGPRHTPPNKAQLLSILTPNGAVRSAVHAAGYPAAGM